MPEPSTRDIPKKGEVYTHPRGRGFWTVEAAGPKFVTLKSSIPHLPRERIPTDGFMRANWERRDA